MELFDTHAHLDEEAFRVDRDEVLARAFASDIVGIVTIGTTAQTSREAVEIAAKHPAVYAAVGIQPNYVAEARPGDWEIVERLAEEPKVVAIGETGLDRYWDHAPIEAQREYFSRHIELSRRLGRPFVVHCRDAEADVVALLREAAAAGPLRGVMHSYSGDLETARACLELGLLISFAGMLTYKKNDALRAVAREIPLDRLLVETDAPYLAPEPRRGKRNEPSFAAYTATRLAEVHGMAPEELAAITTRNARALFGV
jgi:TatD DNase family protein